VVECRCGLCGETEPSRFKIWYDGGVVLHECVSCGLVARHLTPDQAAVVTDYENAIPRGFAERTGPFIHPELGELFADTVSRAAAVVPAGRWLDVGCGDGQLLTRCADAGFEAYGVEACAMTAQAAAELPGLRITQAPYARELFEDATFDVISFVQSLEHFASPAEALEVAHRHLKPSGLLLVEVPSIRAPHFLLYRATGIAWFARPPMGVIEEHVSYFEPTTLEMLTTRCGFETISIITGRWGAKYHGALGLFGRIMDPVFNAARVGGMLYLGRRRDIS